MIAHHNEIHDEIAHLCRMAYTNVWEEPQIHPISKSIEEKKSEDQELRENKLENERRKNPQDECGLPAPQQPPLPTVKLKENDERGDLMIRGFWAGGTDCIIDVRITDTDAPSYIQKKRTPSQILLNHEKEKCRRYAQACIQQRRSFTPFVCSVDGLIGIEAKAFLKRLSMKLSQKWNQRYLLVQNFISTRISIALARATHMSIRLPRVPESLVNNRRFQLEDGEGLRLYHSLI